MRSRSIRVGLFYNLKKDYVWSEGQPNDMDAEWDTLETIEEIQRGLEQNKFEVVNLGDPRLLLSNAAYQGIDIVFSICEMQGYRFREAIVPSLCELLAIPYVFSPPDTMMISSDKNLCNRVVRQAGCMVPEWHLIRYTQGLLDASHFTAYPYIVKPSAEGSGIGVNEQSVVYTYTELRNHVSWILENYSEPAMVQKFMLGREFTVGRLEMHHKVLVLSPLEVSARQPCTTFTYNFAMKRHPDSSVYFHPLQEEPELEMQIADLAQTTFKAIECSDVARVDVRLSDEHIPHFLEINPLPQLHPSFGDFCRSAKAFGMSYNGLIQLIMNNTLSRYNLELD